jgi:hypothetical protein
MISVEYVFKTPASHTRMTAAVKGCSRILFEDFGLRHELDPSEPPDLLVMARDSTMPAGDSAIGLLTLHHTEASRAWELGTMSTRKAYSHNVIFGILMDSVPTILLTTMTEDTQPSWIVKRVSFSQLKLIALLKSMGFVEPQHFLHGVLSNDGYIPFDPFDEVLMKRRLCPPKLEKAERELNTGPTDLV